MDDDAGALIDGAMSGVRVCICPRCKGRGLVGLDSMQADCPECLGCGQTTTNELEPPSETDA